MIDQILINTSDKIEIDVYFDGSLVDPSAINIARILDPDGVIRGSDITVNKGTTTGRYYYTVPLSITDTLGVYTAEWTFVINSIAYTHIQKFQVVSSMRGGYLTTAELRDMTLYERITESEPSDAVLQRYIDRATLLIDNYLGGSVEYTTYNETRRCAIDKNTNGLHVQLLHRPIQSITSASLVYGESEFPFILEVEDFRINPNAGFIEYFGGANSLGANLSLNSLCDLQGNGIVPQINLVYTAGYTTLPEGVRMACILLVEELYKQRFGENRDVVRFRLKDQEEQYANSTSLNEAMAKMGITNANAIMNLLREYKQPSVSAGIVGPLG